MAGRLSTVLLVIVLSIASVPAPVIAAASTPTPDGDAVPPSGGASTTTPVDGTSHGDSLCTGRYPAPLTYGPDTLPGSTTAEGIVRFGESTHDRLVVTHRVKTPDGRDVTFRPGGHEILDSENLTRVSGGDDPVYELNDSATTGSLTVGIDVSKDGHFTVVTDDWAVFSAGMFDVTVEIEKGGGSSYVPWGRDDVPGLTRRVTGGPVTYTGQDYLVGNWTTATRNVGDDELTVAAAPGASPASSPDEVAATLTRQFAGLDLRGSAANGPVTMIVKPAYRSCSSGIARNNFAGRRIAAVDPRISADGFSTWTHEFAHLQQPVSMYNRAGWLTEASATYLQHRLPVRAGDEPEAALRTSLLNSPTYPDATLADWSTWDGELVNYYKGARVLYALDARIRVATNGNATFFTVFRAINSHETLGYPELRAAVVDAANESTATWFDEQVTTTGPTYHLVRDTDTAAFSLGTGVGALPGVGSVPTDPDDDGRYEDIDGDGTATFDDAIALAFADFEAFTPAQRDATDFDGDGDADFDDAIELAFAA
ncbi:MAG: hypothetical protein ACQETI_09450 [Halobacteriota archaeon]